MSVSLSDLGQFIGTEGYTRHWSKRIVWTDGVDYLAEKAQCHWLIDIIASVQNLPRIRNNASLREIQFWTLHKTGGNEARLELVEDSGRKPVYVQVIEGTDVWKHFDGDKIDLRLEGQIEDGDRLPRVLLLPSEH